MPKGVRGRTMIEKNCQICGSSFRVVAGQENRVKTCSRSCGYRLKSESSKKPAHPATCGQCGKDFGAKANELFCSTACRQQYRAARTERACVVCGTKFRTPPSQMHVKTCSTACGYKVRVVANKTEWIRKSCPECGKEFSEPPSRIGGRIFCSKVCMHRNESFLARKSAQRTGDKNPMWAGGICTEAVSATGKKYRRQSQAAEAAKTAKRRTTLLRAIPKWANLAAIEEIYREASRIEKLTGTEYHVDHIVPLQSRIVCGLHCESNLRVLPATSNISKSNRHWPDMP